MEWRKYLQGLLRYMPINNIIKIFCIISMLIKYTLKFNKQFVQCMCIQVSIKFYFVDLSICGGQVCTSTITIVLFDLVTCHELPLSLPLTGLHRWCVLFINMHIQSYNHYYILRTILICKYLSYEFPMNVILTFSDQNIDLSIVASVHVSCI